MQVLTQRMQMQTWQCLATAAVVMAATSTAAEGAPLLGAAAHAMRQQAAPSHWDAQGTQLLQEHVQARAAPAAAY
jgi:hypothetical protein